MPLPVCAERAGKRRKPAGKGQYNAARSMSAAAARARRARAVEAKDEAAAKAEAAVVPVGGSSGFRVTRARTRGTAMTK